MTPQQYEIEYARKWAALRIKESGFVSQEDRQDQITDKVSSAAIQKVTMWLEQHYEGTAYDISIGLKMRHDYIVRVLKYMAFKGAVHRTDVQDIGIYRLA